MGIDASGAMQVTLNEACLTQNSNLLSTHSIQQLSEMQDRIEKFTEESRSLQKKIAELKGENKKVVAFRIRERQTKNEVVAILRTTALERFPTPKKSGIFAKLFRSAQMELEKERFINKHLARHLPKRLDEALRDYHESAYPSYGES